MIRHLSDNLTVKLTSHAEAQLLAILTGMLKEGFYVN